MLPPDSIPALASLTIGQVSRPRALEAILVGGLVAGVLDGLDAVVFYRLYAGVPAFRIFQHIASGLLGAGAVQGGRLTVLLGVILHFAIAAGAAAIYYLASLRFPTLLLRPWLWGPLFGLGVFLFMQHVVLPLSAVYPRRTGGMPWPELADQLFSHMFFVGLSIALLARQATRVR
jgi:hypothetical protein